jgi:hypothetical protein
VVEVPVGDVIEFWYPLHPQTAIEEGRKVIRFEPPVEVLSGERVHQWIGARYRLVGPGSDLERIGRQQQLIRTMLGSGFDFRSALADPDQVRISSAEATSELGSVRPDWSLRTLAGLIPAERDGKQVLVPLDTLGPDCSEGRWPGDPAEG